MARFFAVAMSQAPGLSGMPVCRPLLERGDERVLRQVLGEARRRGPRARGRRSAARTRSARPPRWRVCALARHRPCSAAPRLLRCRSTSARSRSSCARSSGVNSLPKSSASNTGRISISDSRRHRIGQRLSPLDRLLDRLHLPDPVAGDQLLGLGERPVDDGPLAAREPHALALASSAAGPRRRA